MKLGTISRTITGHIGVFSDLDKIVKEMFCVAIVVRKNAQARYSNYHVGAAVQSQKGNIYGGCNVERASWTQTTHAEQNAIDNMVSKEGPVKLVRLAIVAAPANLKIIFPYPSVVANSRKIRQVRFEEIPAPCGHCLQCIWENCQGDGKVELYGLLPTGEVTMITMDNAFPLKFGPEDLGVKYGS